jgi:hypothetical protein
VDIGAVVNKISCKKKVPPKTKEFSREMGEQISCKTNAAKDETMVT